MKGGLLDQLNALEPTEVAHAAFSLIEVLQNQQASIQVHALAAVFLQMCEVLGVDPRVELERSGRVMHDADRKYIPHFKAINDYIKGEIRGKF